MAITSAFQAEDAGSIPAARSNQNVADIAQAVERILGKDEVPSSILGISTILQAFLVRITIHILLFAVLFNKGYLWLRLNLNA